MQMQIQDMMQMRMHDMMQIRMQDTDSNARYECRCKIQM